MSNPIYLQGVRVSFPHLKAPHAAKPTAKPKYQVDLLVNPNDPVWQQIMTRVQEAAVAKYGDHAQRLLEMLQQDRNKRFYGAGSEKVNKKTMQPFDGYDGMMYVAVKKEDRPQIIKADGSPVDSANDMAYQAEAGRIYGGCYVNAAIDVYTSKANDGIFGGLLAIQFLRDGEPFGDGAPDASGMFGAVQTPNNNPSPAGMTTPQQPASPFGQPSTTPQQGMPAPPFGNPDLPRMLGGDD